MYDVIIIGGGAAGLTASLYTSRLSMTTLNITKDIGGQALLAPHIENFPGFMKISGYELILKFEEQAKNYGAQFIYEEVNKIESQKNHFVIQTNNDDYYSKSLIIASGKTPINLNVPGEEKFKGKGVTYCAICDAPLFRDKKVLVVGKGKNVLETLSLLNPFAEKIYLSNHSSGISNINQLKNKLINERKVEYIPNSEVLEIKGENVVKSVILKKSQSQEKIELDIDGIFISLGYKVKTDIVKGIVDLNKTGEIIVSKNACTSRSGVFAAGDVTDISFKQIVISCSEGAKAALSAYNYIQKKSGEKIIKSDWKSLIKE